MTQALQRDPNLWIDREERLVYLDEYVPEDLSATKTAAAALSYAQTFKLHSLPGATKVIYLDFDGQTTGSTAWNSTYTAGNAITSLPYEADNPATTGTFSNNELNHIQAIWQRVAEDYAPFDVDITTEDPGIEALRNTGGGDQNWGIRVVVSPTNWFNTGAGGVAYVGSFSWNSDTPCWVFTEQLGHGDEKAVAEAISHEVGHTLGLLHDGKTDGTAYYAGHGAEPLGWAPIMGVSYYRSITQWSKGEYALANQLQDDLAVMTSGYGINYRADDYGDTPATASPLTVANSNQVSGQGIIERTTDKDCFSFTTEAGQISLNVTGGPRGPNLDIKADLVNASGAVLTSSNPAGLEASLTTTVAAGTYYLLIDGVGTDDLTTGYSDYGSLGEYNISGTIVVTNPLAPVAAATANFTAGLAPLTVNFSSAGSSDSNGNIVSYAWNFGNGTSSTQANDSTVYVNPGVYTAVLTVTDNDGLTDTASVVITVTALPSAPSSLTATAVSNSQINLTWVDNANNETGFQLERSTDNTTWAALGSVAANIQAYSDTGLSASTTYYYRARAFNGSGNSAYSNAVNATTTAVPTYTDYLAAGDMAVTGTLTSNYANTMSDNGATEAITEVLSTGTTTTRYSYLEHKWRFNITAGYGTVFYVNAWQTASTDGDNFQFAYSTNNSTFTPMLTVSATTDSASQSFALPVNLTGAVYIRVIDTNRGGGKVALDKIMVDHMYIRVETKAPPIPNAPTNLAATAVSPTQINLSWTDAASNETGFQVERSLDGSTWAALATTAANVTTASSTGLINNTTYYYRVRALNLGGNSAYSNIANAKTLTTPKMHIGNIDATATRLTNGSWNATLTITPHKADETALTSVVISGTWSSGAAGTYSCTTNSTGRCTITTNNIASASTSATFTISSMTLSGYLYSAVNNHDPDGSSNGTAIVVRKP
ncbi:MAG: fibronectin type III domain-containing protein [Acidobacteria bacterium]|nr:fibronectin type III domain-containing protein [Acidobacteriota bacterium]MBI3426628.1 fibronectin type III domain-containing protein [Acidobacteriota bacterium]